METAETLLNMLEHPWLHINQPKHHGFINNETDAKVYAKIYLKEYITFPYIVEHRNQFGDTYACVHCGYGFQTSDYRSMTKHMENETMCRNGFTLLQCVCGKKFDTLDDAYEHWKRLNCLSYERHKAQERKRQEEKRKQEEEKRQREKEEKQKAREEKKRKCECCNVVFRGKKEEQRHLNGKFHKNKVNPNVLSCSCCEMVFVRQKHLDDHLLTKKHLRKIQECPSSSLPKIVSTSS